MTTSLPRQVRTGLVLFALLSVFDVVFAFVPLPGSDVGPPVWVSIVSLVLGLASLALIVLITRGNRSRALPGTLVGLRLVSALLAVPAFFVPGVPAAFVTIAAVIVVLTVIGCVLVAPTLRRLPSGSAPS